ITPGDKPRDTVYRPLRTSPTFRHPTGHGNAPRSRDVPVPGTKPLPPEFGYASRTSFDDITSLDELDAIARRLYSVAHASPDEARESLRLIVLRDQAELIPPLVHAMQFTQLTEAEISEALRRLSGVNAGVTWFEWAQWLESQPQLVLTPGLAHGVVAMWRALDGKYRHVLPAEQTTQVPKASIYWDGSRVDAITARHMPKAVGPNEGFTLKASDLVLGVSSGGAFRAYPLPQLLFNPIINDHLGGRAITVAYETLCGFPVAYDRGAAAAPDIPEMHWSGLVYRSARLLYTDGSTEDQAMTPRLWDPCTNRSVSGGSAGASERLPLANATVTSWSAWRSAYPQTTVMDVAQAPRASDESLDAQDIYIGTPSLVYPVHLNNPQLPAKERMLLIDMGARDDAIRLGDLKHRSVVNHRFDEEGVVIIVENPLTCTIRVYRRPEGQIFAPSEFVDRVYGSGGGIWKVTEDALVGPDGEALERLPARGLFWFSVDGLNPLTEASLGQSASLVE
ncbi:MAG: DUF3179 domain-containing (seleno)protein, partial [Pseudomonadota bacterium]